MSFLGEALLAATSTGDNDEKNRQEKNEGEKTVEKEARIISPLPSVSQKQMEEEKNNTSGWSQRHQVERETKEEGVNNKDNQQQRTENSKNILLASSQMTNQESDPDDEEAEDFSDTESQQCAGEGADKYYKIDNKIFHYFPTMEDIYCLEALRKEINGTQNSREQLMAIVEEVEYHLTNHHSSKALENVTLARNVESMEEKIIQKKETVEKLEKDLQLAEQEHHRLRQINESLLQGVREKGLEKDRVLLKLSAFAKCEKVAIVYAQGVQDHSNEFEIGRARFTDATKGLTRKIGKHHSDVMTLEQQRLDLKLEVASLKAKLSQLQQQEVQQNFDHKSSASFMDRKGGDFVVGGELNWNRPPNYSHYFRSCGNAECVRLRKQLRGAKKKLQVLIDVAQPHEVSQLSVQLSRRLSVSNMDEEGEGNFSFL